MRSLFSRIIHIASGPVRPIRRWSVVRFLLLGVFWAHFGMACVAGYLVWKQPSTGGSLFGLGKIFTEDFGDPCSLVTPLFLLGVAAFGSLHYLVLRMLPFERRRPFRSWERWLSFVVVALVTVIPALQLKRTLRTRQLFEICAGYQTHMDLQHLEAKGDYRALVTAMEAACSAHREARMELGDHSVYRPSGCGWSYIFTTLTYSNAEAFSENAPCGLIGFLNCVMQSPHEPDPPKSCEPLARAMMESKTPILRLTGLWWIGDFETFAEEVYAHVDSGDLSLFELQVSAASQDTNVQRALQRLTAMRSSPACSSSVREGVERVFNWRTQQRR